MPRFEDYARINTGPLLDNTPIESYFQRGWAKGWQPGVPQSQQTPDMIPNLLNVTFGFQNAVQKRKGFTQILPATVPAQPGEHLWAHPTNAVPGSPTLIDPSQIIVYIDDTDANIYTQSSANLLDATPAGMVDSTADMGAIEGVAANLNPEEEYMIQSFIFDNDIYITSHRFGGSDNGVFTNSTQNGNSAGCTKPIKYDITAGTWSRQAVPDLHLDGDQTGVPRSTAVLVKHARVFYANVASQDEYDYGNRIYWSALEDPATINSNDYITVGSDYDHGHITKTASLGSAIMIFREQDTWSLVGTDEDTFALYSLSSEYGTRAPNSVVVHENQVYFLDEYAGVMSYNGAEFSCVSTDINADLIPALNHTAIYKSCSFVDPVEEKLYVSVPVGTYGGGDEDDRPSQTYVYDMRLDVWTKWDYGFSGAVRPFSMFSALAPAITEAEIWTVGNDDSAGVFKINYGYNDNTAAYNSFFETTWINPQDTGDAHRIRRFEAVTDVSTDAIAVTMYRNFNDEDAWSSTSFTPTGDNDQWHEQDQGYDTGLWTWLKCKFTNNTVDEWFGINGYGFTFSSRPIRRGKRPDLNVSD